MIKSTLSIHNVYNNIILYKFQLFYGKSCNVTEVDLSPLSTIMPNCWEWFQLCFHIYKP